jgi:TRAP-type C4-dicarboxylate transport system permease small subunit
MAAASPPPAAPSSASEDSHLLRVEQEPARLSETAPEGWLALGLFWLLGVTVAIQFFTRYALGSSAAWTEEIARYLLIGMVFIGASVGVVRDSHIRVDFLQRTLPPRAGRILALADGLIRTGFFACMVVLTLVLMQRIGDSPMTVVELPMNIVYAGCEVGFLAMTGRAAQRVWREWRGARTPEAPVRQE